MPLVSSDPNHQNPGGYNTGPGAGLSSPGTGSKGTGATKATGSTSPGRTSEGGYGRDYNNGGGGVSNKGNFEGSQHDTGVRDRAGDVGGGFDMSGGQSVNRDRQGDQSASSDKRDFANGMSPGQHSAVGVNIDQDFAKDVHGSMMAMNNMPGPAREALNDIAKAIADTHAGVTPEAAMHAAASLTQHVFPELGPAAYDKRAQIEQAAGATINKTTPGATVSRNPYDTMQSPTVNRTTLADRQPVGTTLTPNGQIVAKTDALNPPAAAPTWSPYAGPRLNPAQRIAELVATKTGVAPSFPNIGEFPGINAPISNKVVAQAPTDPTAANALNPYEAEIASRFSPPERVIATEQLPDIPADRGRRLATTDFTQPSTAVASRPRALGVDQYAGTPPAETAYNPQPGLPDIQPDPQNLPAGAPKQMTDADIQALQNFVQNRAALGNINIARNPFDTEIGQGIPNAPVDVAAMDRAATTTLGEPIDTRPNVPTNLNPAIVDKIVEALLGGRGSTGDRALPGGHLPSMPKVTPTSGPKPAKPVDPVTAMLEAIFGPTLPFELTDMSA